VSAARLSRLPAELPPLRLRRARRTWFRLDREHPDDWVWTPPPEPRSRFDSATGFYRARYGASSARGMLRETFDPGRHLTATDLDRWVVEVVLTGNVVDLRTDDTLDLLGLDDQISTSRSPEVWATAQTLGDLVWKHHSARSRPVPSIVYRSRTTPQHNSNVALFGHNTGVIRASRLRELPGLLEAAITADGFTVEL
jgi:hypothetical protein